MDFETNGVTVNVDPTKLSDEQLTGLAQEVAEAARERDLELPAFVAGTLAVAEAETPVERTPLTPETLLATFDSAYLSYSFLLDATNTARAEAKGRKKPAQLETVEPKFIRQEVEDLLTNPAILAELQGDIDHFTMNPEAGSPEVGFDIVIVPEGLTTADEEAIAKSVQAKITTDYNPYIRGDRYNDPRTPEVTGKGYRIAFAPRHYNVSQDVASEQTSWMKLANLTTHKATSLQTATDAEALAFINSLQEAGELNDPNTRFNQTYFRRFDQKPFDDYVSRVCVHDDGLLGLGGSFVRNGNPSRALVVPKLKA